MLRLRGLVQRQGDYYARTPLEDRRMKTPALPTGFSLPNPLYALTLAQPWPQMFLLPEEPKRVENRMWMPLREQLVPGGWFALHGGRLPKSPKEFNECRDTLDWVNSNVWGMSADPDEWELSR